MIDFEHHKFAILGLGQTGHSILRYLTHNNVSNDRIGLFDSRVKIPPTNINLCNYDHQLGNLEYQHISIYDVIIVSPGISIYNAVIQSAIRNAKIVINDLDLFGMAVYNNWASKIIGVTGSNGKSTVVTFIGHVLTALNYSNIVIGNIGNPVLDAYLDTDQIPMFVIIELSSFQLEIMRHLKLDIACVLNISADHLDRYSSILEYAYHKSSILNNARIQILNHDDQIVCAMERLEQHTIWFSQKPNHIFYLNGDSIVYDSQPLININSMHLIGTPNYINTLAVLTILFKLNIAIDNDLIRAIQSFTGLPHRMQLIATRDSIKYIEDSKGTNVGATIAGISALRQPVNLILGGDGKGQSFNDLCPAIKDHCRSVAIIGKDKMKIYDTIKQLSLPITMHATLEEAVHACRSCAHSGDIILLSPACASWDMFNDYKHRAKVFENIVNSI